MSVSFVSLPMADLCSPPLGIAQIVGFLGDKFKHEIMSYDLNIEFIYYCLNKENLKKNLGYVKKYINSVDKDSCQEIDKYRFFFECNFTGEYLCKNIDSAVCKLKNIDTYHSWADYCKYSSIIERSLKLFSARYYPTQITSGAILFQLKIINKESLEKIIIDKKINPLIDFYLLKISSIIQENTKFLGISINYLEQVIPAVTLAKIVKTRHSDVKIVAGGALFSAYKERINELDIFSAYFDGLIIDAGENSWQQILENKSMENIEGCLISTGNRFIKNKISRRTLQRARPDFHHFIFEKYLTPKVILPYTLSIGCYWGKCTFCAYQSYKDNLVCKPEFLGLDKKIIKDFDYFNEMYNASYFYIVDEAIPPLLAKSIANIISKEELSYKWYGEMRFESALDLTMLKNIKEGGCALILFGLESGCDRILEKMKKGTSSYLINRILQDCGKLGIKTMPMLFFGFPTESESDAMETLELIKNNMENIQFLGLGVFLLLKNIPVHMFPDKYNVKIIPNKDNLALYDNYNVSNGMSQSEAVKLLNVVYKSGYYNILLNKVLISRSHLIFLPKEKKTEEIYDYNINLNKKYILKSKCYFFENKYDWFNNCFSRNNIIYICNMNNYSIFKISKQIKNIIYLMKNGKELNKVIENYNVSSKEGIINSLYYLHRERVIIEI